jgi:hypothetical protein
MARLTKPLCHFQLNSALNAAWGEGLSDGSPSRQLTIEPNPQGEGTVGATREPKLEGGVSANQRVPPPWV